MKTRSRTSMGLLVTATVIAASIVTAPAATAAPEPADTSSASRTHVTLSDEDVAGFVTEAHRLGLVENERVDADGAETTTIDLGAGFVVDVTIPAASRERLGAGSDQYGAFVSFNATDQNLIISGGLYAVGVGLCALSAGVFCVVAGAIVTAASVAITSNGGIRCGTKALRVYPFSGHAPRCA